MLGNAAIGDTKINKRPLVLEGQLIWHKDETPKMTNLRETEHQTCEHEGKIPLGPRRHTGAHIRFNNKPF